MDERRRFLLLGGPFGPFFRQLAGALEARGAEIHRVNLNAAEAANWGWRRATRFNRAHEEWPAYVAEFIKARAITDLVVYGDCQFYHRTALAQAEAAGVRRHVFEHGYFRPDWITCERDGVNGYSRLPRDPEAILREAAAVDGAAASHEKVGTITPYHVAHTMLDYVIYALGWPAWRRYRWPYPNGVVSQALGHARRALRLSLARGRRIAPPAGPYYLCLLQREGDSQILFHSPFASVAGFYEHVMQNFARHAPADTTLLIKNHPLDPGIHDHGHRIARFAAALGLEERVRFVDGGSLAELARPARGVVTINSTAGISTVQFGTPTVALGEAIYDLPGLTFQGGLERFWTDAARPDMTLFHAFHRFVLARTQINGNFYAPRGRRMALEACAARLMADDA
ncbi:MAG TPA: capsular biosynthesis protein [Rhizomicrobium sp.]|nr:capsular biosynthesis protein [Rhizomicrobium sp.]